MPRPDAAVATSATTTMGTMSAPLCLVTTVAATATGMLTHVVQRPAPARCAAISPAATVKATPLARSVVTYCAWPMHTGLKATNDAAATAAGKPIHREHHAYTY